MMTKQVSLTSWPMVDAPTIAILLLFSRQFPDWMHGGTTINRVQGRHRHMGRLEDAQGRLDQAIARLEAVAAQPDRGAAPLDKDGVLTAAKARCDLLETRSKEVSGRLDNAIARLHTILEEDHGAG